MNRILAFPLSLVLLLAALPALAGEMTLEQALAKHYEARGGLEKMEAVHSLHVKGKMGLPQGMEAPLETWWEAPNHFRVEFSFQGMTAIRTFDGKEGWSLMPFTGKTEPERMPDEQVEQAKTQSDWMGILVHAKDKGITLEWKGPADVDGSPAFRIDAIDKDGKRTEVYLDGETFLELREVRHVEQAGRKLEVRVDYGDYQEVDGLVFPFVMRTSIPGIPGGQSLTIETLEVNPEIPAGLFGKPAAPKPSAAKPAN